MQSRDLQFQNMLNQARRLYRHGDLVGARRTCEELLRIRKKSPDVFQLLANINWHENRQDEAIRQMEQYLTDSPTDIESRLSLASWLTSHGRGRAAAAHYQKILKNQKNMPLAIAGLANAYETLGDHDKAESVMKPFIDSGEEHWSIARAYVIVQHNQKNYEEAIRIARRHVYKLQTEDSARRAMCFYLGQSLEKLGDFDGAFQAYQTAHKNAPSTIDRKSYFERTQHLMDVLSPDLLKKLPRAKIKSDLPVFISCQPRSGSTLIERIIAANPKAHAGGELPMLSNLGIDFALKLGSIRPYPDCYVDLDQESADRLGQEYIDDMRKLAPTAQRITDKNVSIWHRLGMIELIMPQSHIIDLRRNTVDNCLGCYSSNLDPHDHPHVENLSDLATVFCAFEALMRYWKENLQIPILTVNYEDIIEDQETWTRRIIEFCGLPWHDASLHFHKAADKSKQTAAITLSYNQVRQPLYKTSVGRAEKFAPHLGPLLEGLEEGRRYWNLDVGS